jgi:large conductance mechanosensitive channel
MVNELSKQRARRVRAAKTRQARKTATIKAQNVNSKAKSHVSGFMDFIRNQGVVGLAVGLVLGVQVKAVVDQIVASFINPLLGLVLPGSDSLEKKSFIVHLGTKQPQEFTYGAFISVMISFITVALLVYYGVKALKLDKLDKKT